MTERICEISEALPTTKKTNSKNANTTMANGFIFNIFGSILMSCQIASSYNKNRTNILLSYAGQEECETARSATTG